jgi:anti-sigma B factor antagonist
MPLDVATADQPNGAVVVKVTGALALGRDSQKVESTVEPLIRMGRRRLILDLSGVDHIDSTGVGIVAFCFGRLKAAGGSLRVVCAPGKVREIFRITAVDQLAPFDDSLQAALAAI